MTPEQHAAQHALVLASERATHHPDVYPVRKPRGTDSPTTSGDIGRVAVPKRPMTADEAARAFQHAAGLAISRACLSIAPPTQH